MRFVRAQESKLQSQTHEMNQMREWMVQSLAEARARDAQIEASTEKKIQEAVEIERKSARALSEERRRLYRELERRLREELRHEIRQEAAVAAADLAEKRAESGFRQESATSRWSSEVLPPQGLPLTFAPLSGPAGD